MSYWYISFATDETGFLGATVVQADNVNLAIAEATERGLNPGGEAAIFEVPDDAVNNPDVQALINRLANKAEMIAQGGKRLGDLSEEVQATANIMADVVCADCNDPSSRS